MKAATGVPSCPTSAQEVSIHAAVKAATAEVETTGRDIVCFNSRGREGRDGNIITNDRSYYCFNSRGREGRDKVFEDEDEDEDVSIHAAVKAATIAEG